MQAQATGSRRFGLNRIAMLTLVIGALISAVAVVINNTVDLPFTSESQAVTARPLDRMAGYNRIGYLEQNVQLPDGVLAEPAQSVEQMRFLEQNIWEYSGAPAAYQGLDTYQPQPDGLDYKFLEENIWNVGPADTSPEAVGIHRDEHFDDGMTE